MVLSFDPFEVEDFVVVDGFVGEAPAATAPFFVVAVAPAVPFLGR